MSKDIPSRDASCQKISRVEMRHVKRNLRPVKRDQRHVKRDQRHVKRDQRHVKRDLDGRLDVTTFDVTTSDDNILRCVMSHRHIA